MGLQHKYRQLSFMGELPWDGPGILILCILLFLPLFREKLFWDTTKGTAVLHIILSSQRFALEGSFKKYMFVI